MINIALDGPAGSGKSTIAKAISEKLGILYLDTGALYRACALKAYILGVDCKNEAEVKKFISDADISVGYDGNGQITYLDGKDVSDKIRKNEISMRASDISAHKCVRDKLLSLQREIAAKNDCVLDGRDIGTFVLPDAAYKFFITASIEVRAKRRYNELLNRGQSVDFEELKNTISKRDYNDAHREIAPLKQADDAVLIDTSDMTISEVIEKVMSYIG